MMRFLQNLGRSSDRDVFGQLEPLDDKGKEYKDVYDDSEEYKETYSYEGSSEGKKIKILKPDLFCYWQKSFKSKV